MWGLVCLPLVVAGTLVGRKFAAKDDFPCRVNHLKRPIPEGRWCVRCTAPAASLNPVPARRYTHPVTLALAGGVLPFGSIFIEMYFIFTSFWNYKFYYVYGFMLLVYVILIIVTVCVTIVATYCLLNAEVPTCTRAPCLRSDPLTVLGWSGAGLPLAMDVLPVRGLDCALRVPVRCLLLLH